MTIYIVTYLVLLALVLMFNYGASKVTGDFHVAKPKEGGFTLIELIIVIAVISIAATIIVGGILLFILGKVG